MDSSGTGEELGPWTIRAQPQNLFVDEEKKVEIPHTASVVVCHDCQGAGKIQCWKCKVGLNSLEMGSHTSVKTDLSGLLIVTGSNHMYGEAKNLLV